MYDWADEVPTSLSNDPFACIQVWGDAAPYTKTDSLLLVAWALLNGTRQHLVSQKFWFCILSMRTLCRCGCDGQCHYDIICAVLAWSFSALLAGVYPAYDHLNNKFPEGSYRAKLAGHPLRIRGGMIYKVADWYWFHKVLDLCGWSGQRICYKCPATLRGILPAYDFRACAEYLNRLLTQADYRLSMYRKLMYRSKIWNVPGFSIHRIKPDWMHVVCLGIIQVLLGNMLWEQLVAFGGIVKKKEANKSALRKLCMTLRICAHRLNCELPFAELTVGMIRSEYAPPKLKQKAADARHTLPIIHLMFKEFIPMACEHSRTRFRAIDCLLRCYDIMDKWDNATSPRELKDAGRAHLLHYAELSKAAHITAATTPFWRLIPKHHQFVHVIEDCRVCPRKIWAYGFESKIGDAARAARGCNCRHLNTRLMENYLIFD